MLVAHPPWTAFRPLTRNLRAPNLLAQDAKAASTGLLRLWKAIRTPIMKSSQARPLAEPERTYAAPMYLSQSTVLGRWQSSSELALNFSARARDHEER